MLTSIPTHETTSSLQQKISRAAAVKIRNIPAVVLIAEAGKAGRDIALFYLFIGKHVAAFLVHLVTREDPVRMDGLDQYIEPLGERKSRVKRCNDTPVKQFPAHFPVHI